MYEERALRNIEMEQSHWEEVQSETKKAFSVIFGAFVTIVAIRIALAAAWLGR